MPEAHSQRVEFGKFILDLNRGTLQASGKDIKLRPQAFEVLSLLAANSGTLVSKDELLSAVWHGVPVTDDSLTQCIVEIRKAFGDKSRTIVRTIPKRGYIFDPPESMTMDLPDRRWLRAENAHGRFRQSWLPVSAFAVILLAVFAVSQWQTPEDTNPIVDDLRTDMPRNSIAVLPFVDMSESQDQQYFGDGIAEEILTKLTEFPELVVMARTSSFLFRDRQQDVAAIGRSLNSAHVLEGSIRRSGNQLRISAQLIETRAGTHVWSKSFDRELTVENLFDIQAEVAASVAESIASGPTFAGRRPDQVRKAANTEAYDLYLEGMYYFHQIRPVASRDFEIDFFESAIERFEASIDKDPNWAAPHVAIARTMQFRAGILNNNEAHDWFRLSKEHLLQAIRIDPDHALAYSALGYVLFRLDFDFPAAEAAYARARALGDYVPWSYAIFLAKSGRYEEAIEEYRLAIEHDPLSAGPRQQLAGVYRCLGRYGDSIAELEQLLLLAPARDDLYIALAYLYLKTGEIERGRETFEQFRNPETELIRYGPIYALLGEVDKASKVLEQAEAAETWWPNYVVSTAQLLGEEERALDYLEAAASDDPRRLLHMQCTDDFAVLADQTRFQQLLRKAGFPELQR